MKTLHFQISELENSLCWCVFLRQSGQQRARHCAGFLAPFLAQIPNLSHQEKSDRKSNRLSARLLERREGRSGAQKAPVL